jgi:hypothetical protein
MNDIFKENGALIIAGLVASVGIATQWPAIQQHQNQQAAIAQSQSSRIQAGEVLAAEQAARVGEIEIANERYDQGCEVISTLKMDTATTIIENGPIVSGAYAKVFNPLAPNPGHYIGRDIVVCDLYGTTAITRYNPALGYAVASSIAVTNDRKRMQAAQDRMKLARPNLTK